MEKAKKVTAETADEAAMKAKQAQEERQELDRIIATVKVAQQKYATYSQEQVDEIFRAAALAANNARIPLAKMAVEETGMPSAS